MKFGVVPFSVTGVALPNVGAPGAVMQTFVLQGGGALAKERTVGLLLLDELLLEELLDELPLDELVFDELLLLDAVLVVGAALPPPPPLEQAAKARRHTDTVSRTARHDVSMALPKTFLPGNSPASAGGRTLNH